MTTAVGGQATTLLARFESAGVETEPELPITLTITPAAGGAAIVTTSTLVTVSVGTFSYSWTPPLVEESTDYVVAWDPSGDDVAATEVVTVLPAVTGSWCTVGQALGFTSKTLTAEQLTLGSGVITLYAGVTPDQPEDSITTRDRYWLAMATAYQSAWMAARAGYFDQRESHISQSADGVSVQRESGSDVTLAPLAARTLKNLSWMGTTSRLIVPDGVRPKGSFLAEEADAYHSWTPRPIT